jgi:hypothetical protein
MEALRIDSLEQRPAHHKSADVRTFPFDYFISFQFPSLRRPFVALQNLKSALGKVVVGLALRNDVASFIRWSWVPVDHF